MFMCNLEMNCGASAMERAGMYTFGCHPSCLAREAMCLRGNYIHYRKGQICKMFGCLKSTKQKGRPYPMGKCKQQWWEMSKAVNLSPLFWQLQQK